jgi:hypothetical protein
MSEEELRGIHEGVKREREERRRRDMLIRYLCQRRTFQEKGVHCTLLSGTCNCLQTIPIDSTVSINLYYLQFPHEHESTVEHHHIQHNRCFNPSLYLQNNNFLLIKIKRKNKKIA